MPEERNDVVSTDKIGALIKALQWLYDQISGSGSQAEADTGAVDTSCENEIDRWIALASISAGTAGFATNVGGLLTLPIALPANLIGVAAIQLRLIASIARCRGYKIDSPEVQTLAIGCLVGSALFDILKDAGIQIGLKLGHQAISRISGAALIRINQAVGFRLLTKAGSQGVVNFTKVVPVLGGLVGGSLDGFSTKAVGEIAKRVFVRVERHDGPEFDHDEFVNDPPDGRNSGTTA